MLEKQENVVFFDTFFYFRVQSYEKISIFASDFNLN